MVSKKKAAGLWAVLVSAVLIAPPAGAGGKPNIVWDTSKKDKCTSSEKTTITNALQWLIDNIGKVDKKMGKNGLKDWPGRSKKKFTKKLEKKLKFACVSERRRCQKSKDGSILRGRVVPILHQRRVTLCTNHLSGDAEYVSVIAHEIAHLVRLNKHRRKCKKKYEKPRFSQSVGLAAFHAYEGTAYESADYTKYCS